MSTERPRWPLRSRLPFLLGILGLAGSGDAFGQAEPKGKYSESLIVRERTFFVDDSVLPRLESATRRGPSDFLVMIDGSPAEAVDPGPDELPEISHVVWLDSELASPAALARAAKMFANALDAFPDGGSFEIVEASSGPPIGERLARSELVLRLSQLESESNGERDSLLTTERRIAALNRLAIEIPRHTAGEIGAVWLLAEPWALEPAEVEEIVNADLDETLSTSTIGALQRTARILATRGWVVFPVSAPREDAREPPRALHERPSDEQFFDRGTSPQYDAPWSGILRWIFPRKRVLRTRRTPSPSLARSLDLATEIRLAPMARLARETSGSQAGDSMRISELAERLGNRRRLVVRDSSPDAGGLRSVEIVWIGGDGRTLPAAPWIATLSPLELGISRLLTVVEGTRASVGAPLRLRSIDSAQGGAASLCFAYPRKRAAIRVLGWIDAEKRFEVGPNAEAGELEAGCAPLPENLAGSDFVQLEALDSLEWGASRFSQLR